MFVILGNMIVVIKNMEKKGWVLCYFCLNDKRVFLVSLIIEGEEVIKKVLLEYIKCVEDVFLVLIEIE